MKQTFDITGMSCSACVARVEKAAKTVSGIDTVSVALLDNSLTVTGEFNEKEIIAAVKKAGYGAKIRKDVGKNVEDKPGFFQVFRRFLISLILLIPLLYLTMGHGMFGFPIPEFMDNFQALGITEALLSLAILLINGKFFVNGFKGLLHGSFNMDTLVSLGSGISFIYSVIILILKFNLPEGVPEPSLFFESAAMIPVLITLGKSLEELSKRKTTGALDSLRSFRPETAFVLRDGAEIELPAEELKTDDLVSVRPGSAFPADGEVLEGTSSVNESMLTGESLPVDKFPGDSVSAGTINGNGLLKIRVLKVGKDTLLENIIRTVSETAASKAPIERLADKIAGIFVPVVIGIALVTFILWMIFNGDLETAILRGISVLVVSCPCALGLATPVAITVGSGVGARLGILFKNAETLEVSGKIQKVVLDKTGTITNGLPAVTDLIPAEDTKEGFVKLLSVSYALEKNSEHPLAGAVVRYAEHLPEAVARMVEPEFSAPLVPEIEDLAVFPGEGISGRYLGQSVHTGNYAYIARFTAFSEKAVELSAKLAKSGKTPLFFEENGTFLGIIAVADTLKEDAVRSIRELKAMGLTPVLLSGDRKETAEAIAEKAGIPEVIAEVLPTEKAERIRELTADGSVVMMVGDGINDAPALTAATVGAAIGAGTDAAKDAGNLILLNSEVRDVVRAVRLGRATRKTVKENLFWAFFYNVIMIPLAAGALAFAGITLTPMLSAAAMSISSLTVVLNALRLNRLEKRL